MPVQNEIPVILVTVGAYHLLLPVSDIRYIIRAAALVPVPDAPAYIAGAINYHGELLPVVDLRKKFGLEPIPLNIHQYFAIVANKQNSLALILDEINGQEIIEPSMIQADNMQIVAERVISSAVQIDNITHYMLNTARMFSDTDTAVLLQKISHTVPGVLE